MSYKDLFQRLTTDDFVLTANRRLAATLRQHYDIHQRQQGLEVWSTPTIMPLVSGLSQAWDNIRDRRDRRALLSQAQERVLWQRIIQHSSYGELLLRPDATAELVSQAWHTLKQWGVPVGEIPLSENNEDVAAFLEWSAQFQARCENLKCIDIGSVLEKLSSRSDSTPLFSQRRITVVGFDRIPPAYQQFFDLLKEHQHSVIIFNPAPHNESPKRLACQTPETELTTMARFASQQFAADPNQTLGCIVHNLQDIRLQIERIFTEIMPASSCFNISAGRHLNEFPCIQTALRCLTLARHHIPIEEMTTLLLSPFMTGAGHEHGARATLDAALRLSGSRTVNLRSTLALARDNKKPHGCPLWTKAIENYLGISKDTQPSRCPSGWAQRFTEQLHSLGWPGERGLSSSEYQQVMRWQQLLQEFASLDHVIKEMDYNTALSTLNDMACRVEFQPQTNEAPIQILGTLESAGLFFDRLWVTGLTDEAWPAPAKPNPFLPIKLQRAMKMPHSSANHELDYCQHLTQRLAGSADQVIFSYPAQEDDRVLGCSPLIGSYQVINTDMLGMCADPLCKRENDTAPDFEIIDDQQAPPIKPDEPIHGGSTLFKQQALCPFRAFAELRLAAVDLASPHTGLDPSERGQLLHAALESVWNRLECQERLHECSDVELKTMINEAVDHVLAESSKRHHALMRDGFTRLERTRLIETVAAWLECEKSRPPFRVIAQEEWQNTRMGDIDLHLRVDRVDQLSDELYAIIDYKTGPVSIQGWFGDRPSEPQLPLYCVTSDFSVSALVLAQVRKGKMSFKGVAEFDGTLDGVVTSGQLKDELAVDSWSELLNGWHGVLTRLGEDFRRGHAAVDPKNPQEACRYCSLEGLCRVDE